MPSMKELILSHLIKVLPGFGIDSSTIKLEYPENSDHGDFSTNIAMAYAKKLNLPPKILAEKIVVEFQKEMPTSVSSVEVAGPGFINFKMKDIVIAEEALQEIKSLNFTKDYSPQNPSAFSQLSGESDHSPLFQSGIRAQKVMIEYTDPNPFKVFHIGHLMSNAIGESISRLYQETGSDVVRACYQGDVGLHVGKTIWAILNISKDIPDEIEKAAVTEKVKWLGEMYIAGSQIDEGSSAYKEIQAVNKQVFDKSDPIINVIYEKGRRWSLEYFDQIYTRLGTKFDTFFFESALADAGIAIVNKFSAHQDGSTNENSNFISQPVFTKSDGAVVFKGEDHGLHTRVFITSQGLPTYETKELGLNTEKFKLYPDLDQSIIITANEQSDYFRVLLKVFSIIDPAIFQKTKHISHGMMRFASGKMSSRKGNIVSADGLIGEIKEMVLAKISDREFSAEEKDELADIIAIGAIKYTILRSSVGSDIIFDSAASISFEGDSGPYLQYSAVRAASILEKAKDSGFKINDSGMGMIGSHLGKVGAQSDEMSEGLSNFSMPDKVGIFEKLLTRFPDIISRAKDEVAPQTVANYLITLAGAFNAFYANQTIVDEKDPLSPYRVALTEKFLETMTKGLWVLGIKVPKRM